MTENETNTAVAEPVDWDALQVGDPEPPPLADRDPCLMQSNDGWLCCRPEDHGGRQHVAVLRDLGVVAVWPVDGAR